MHTGMHVYTMHPCVLPPELRIHLARYVLVSVL